MIDSAGHMQLRWRVLVLRGHGLLHRDVQDPAQLDHRALLHLRVGCGLLAQPALRASCTSRCGVLGLQIWPTGSARGERPPQDLPFGVRIVDAGSERSIGR